MVDAIRDYGQDQELAKQFLKDFTSVNDEGQIQPKYSQQLTQLANREAIHMFVELSDLEQYNQDLARQVLTNTVRYNDIFYGALDEILPTYKTRDPDIKDIMDVFIEQRLMISERNQRVQQTTNSSQAGNTNRPNDVEGRYPPDLIRRAEIFFKPSTLEAQPIREVKAKDIGHLVTVRGIVTRTTDVKPKITVVTYTCDQCGCETFQPVRGTEFTPLIECSSNACKTNKTLGRLTMQTRGSKFIKFQEIRLQEHSDQVPTGHIPRSIRVSAFGEQTRQCAPGDHISVSGVYLPIEKSGYRMRTGGLTADTYLEAHYITQMSKASQSDEQLNNEPMPQEEAEELMLGHNNFLRKLSSSIAPEIYGHEKLKQALLLLLVGGVDKNSNGMKIRGNINICLMGDPGVAKSQLLNFIDRLAPRSQLTSGRGSSGVGLTAAVLRDPVTNEFVLEGGALVLADRGICCIDEFDKMVDADRTAIHEVMEQQTVSIAKAGIMTVLNARVSILAAANPAYGRYNQHRSITDNLQLPPALLSRFDLLWLIKDQPNEERDLNLAEHITSIHKNPNQEISGDYDTLDMKVMRRYINLCQTKNPIVPENLAEKLVDIYHDIRARKRTGGDNALFTSPRSLLAIIRLSTAFARLRLGDVVVEEDIDAALSLYNASRESIEEKLDGKAPLSLQVLRIIREISESTNSRTVSLNDLLQNSATEGLSSDQIDEALEQLMAQESINFEGGEIDLLS